MACPAHKLWVLQSAFFLIRTGTLLIGGSPSRGKNRRSGSTTPNSGDVISISYSESKNANVPIVSFLAKWRPGHMRWPPSCGSQQPAKPSRENCGCWFPDSLPSASAWYELVGDLAAASSAQLFYLGTRVRVIGIHQKSIAQNSVRGFLMVLGRTDQASWLRAAVRLNNIMIFFFGIMYLLRVRSLNSL